MFIAAQAKYFGGQWRMFERDSDDIPDPEDRVVLGDGSDIPEGEPEGCPGGCGCKPDNRIGFRTQIKGASA